MQDNHNITIESLYLRDEEATQALAMLLAPMLCGTNNHTGPGQKGGRIHLHGELGAGKTSFVRALLRAAGITGRTKSPSYSLLESYNLFNLYFYHLRSDERRVGKECVSMFRYRW